MDFHKSLILISNIINGHCFLIISILPFKCCSIKRLVKLSTVRCDIYIYIYLRRSAKHQYSFYLAAKELESLKEILMYFLKRLLGGTLEVIRGEREEDKEGKCLFTFNFVVHKRMKLAKTNK